MTLSLSKFEEGKFLFLKYKSCKKYNLEMHVKFVA